MTPAELRAWRKSNNLTQSDIASTLGISESGYRSYETGRRDPGPMFWLAIQWLQVRDSVVYAIRPDKGGTT